MLTFILIIIIILQASLCDLCVFALARFVSSLIQTLENTKGLSIYSSQINLHAKWATLMKDARKLDAYMTGTLRCVLEKFGKAVASEV